MLVLTAATLAAPAAAPAEAHVQTGPHPLGTLTLIGNDPKCATTADKTSAGVPADSTCQSFSIACQNPGGAAMPDRKGYYALSRATAALRGMVVMFSGGPGKDYWGEGTEFNSASPAYHFVTDLRSSGFDVVQVRWADSWTASGESVDAGAHVACRPATAIKWVKDNLYVNTAHATGVCGFCTLGSSGGSAQVTWPLSHYGAGALVAGDPLVDAVFPTGGPTHAALRKGCVPGPDETGYRYDGSTIRQIDGIFGYTSKSSTSPWFEDAGPCNTRNTSSTWATKWDVAGIDTGGDNYNYPETRVHIVVGQLDVPMRHHSLDFALSTWNAGSPMVTRQVVSGMNHAVSLSTAGMAALKSAVLSTAAPQSRGLTVTKPTNGIVTSGDSQIACPGFCSAGYPLNATVTLTATPNQGYAFAGWTGDCTNTSGTCAVTMSANRTVTATFVPATMYDLTLSKTAGGGTVTDGSGQINCAPECTTDSGSYASGSVVTLTATPAVGYAFQGWNGACTNTSGTCSVTMTSAKNVTALFGPPTPTYALNVSTTGQGSVSSDKGGISCPGSCSAQFSSGEVVELTAAASSTSRFAGWDGCDSVNDIRCTVTMTTDKTVTATFEPLPTALLTVTPPVNGTVTSPEGIDCPGDCEETFVQSATETVTLTANPAPGFVFQAWTGDCEGVTAPECTVTMDQARSVEATFTPAPTHDLTVVVQGSGAVTSDPAGVTGCRETDTCVAAFTEGQSVVLTPDPDDGHRLASWNDSCDSITGDQCTVAMTTDRTVTATFEALPTWTLTVTHGGGSGSVTSSAGGIDCPGDCEEAYSQGTPVTLTAAPGQGFTGTWSGDDCTGPATTPCTMTMTEDRGVTITFEAGAAHVLTVTKSGTGTGTVTSNPAGIDCGPTCTTDTGDFSGGQVVTLSAAASSGSSFVQWLGACSGLTCTVTMSEARTVEAVFNTGGVQAVTVSDTGYTPKSLNGVMGNTVRWTFSTTNSQSVTDVKNLGNTGTTARPWFDSGLRTSGVFAHQFPAAGLYSYRSNGSAFTGSVSIPMTASPTSGTIPTPFNLTWSSAAMAGYGFQVEYEFKATGETGFKNRKLLGGVVQTAPSGQFVPDQGKGTYRFRVMLRNSTTGILGGASPWLSLSVT